MVVPRKGDVDRNNTKWLQNVLKRVVPRKGDVDRNLRPAGRVDNTIRRPPQGGRG